MTLEEIKGRLACVIYSDDVPWTEVEQTFGRPDEAPPPAPGSLFRNVRIYKEKAIILYVETKETTEAGRSKFIEVVRSLELCKEK
jgi:hypothetical protein